MAVKQFEITKNCSLNCSFCYNKEERTFWGEDFTLEDIKKNTAKGDLIFIGGGEPFLNKELLEITNYLAEEQIKNIISTSGIIYKPIHKHSELQISLPAITKKTYEEIVGVSENYLKKTLKNIEQFKKEGYRIGINLPIYEGNFSDLETISDYCNSLELHLRVRPIIPSNGLKVSEEFVKQVKKKTLNLILKNRDITFTENGDATFEMYTPNGKIKNYFSKKDSLS